MRSISYITPDHYDGDPGVPIGSNIAGYYKQYPVNRNTTAYDVYDSSGNYYSSITCNTNGGCTYYKLQGFYDENNNLVLVDYKTDNILSGEELINRYTVQLKYYKKALEEILHTNVYKTFIYKRNGGKNK